VRPARLLALALLLPLLGPGATAADDGGGLVILSSYRSLMGVNARPRQWAHAGIDIAAAADTPVLAAADGSVFLLIDYQPGCGVGVVLAHPAFARWTVYCHMTRTLVRRGQTVSRGQPLGLSGASGNAGHVAHVHFEVCTRACNSHRDGDLRGTQDPLPLMAGCFDPARAYPADRLALTWPLACPRGAAEARR
jgi:murein DD-endopeptidase MepM/ murein hydrolase activator NlpD